MDINNNNVSYESTEIVYCERAQYKMQGMKFVSCSCFGISWFINWLANWL